MQQRIVEQIVDVLIPHIKKATVEVFKIAPQEQFSDRICEQIVGVLVPQGVEQLVNVPKISSQHRILQRARRRSWRQTLRLAGDLVRGWRADTKCCFAGTDVRFVRNRSPSVQALTLRFGAYAPALGNPGGFRGCRENGAGPVGVMFSRSSLCWSLTGVVLRWFL